MRRLIVTQNATVDGAVEMLDSWFDPRDQDPELAAELRRQDETNDALLLGRQTFEDFRGYWPQQTDDTTGVADQLDRVHKYVVSTTLGDPGWMNSTVLHGDPVEEVGRLKDVPGQDIVCTGSITLAHTLITAGLVDEFRIFTFPAIQGRGRRFFPDGHAVDRLRAVDVRRFGNGVVYTAWAPTG
ncbi:dihydrofolate reductase family protein [Tersicoccus sp. Bi-70]|uniref:dihydrofolate reductase family protein n=1 Tax=Tersicoccus sp. Bi-70 TaxID=1897634 RepID=UPI0009782F7A|nr:dihydrofolate reductase family protein [Tersicoccus sp. Bi-70]OMH31187.1 dihydrofolate reductase [Tersicoccus sp. Bi-70]